MLALFFLACAGPGIHAVPPSEPTRADEEVLVVGALIHDREVGALHVRVEAAGYLVPLDSFADIASCSVSVVNGVRSLSTPLGMVTLLQEDIRESGGVVYLRELAIEEKLATPVAFDESRFALDFDLPWRSVAQSGSTFPREPPVPDATPPNLSLSTLQSDLRHSRDAQDGSYNTSTTLSGRMFDGSWRLRYQDDLAGTRALRDYAWFHARDNKLFLAGHQRVRLHPLLRSVELTGVQMAATNQSLGRFYRSAEPGALLSRNLQPISAFRGPGPPAGVAELWVDGALVGRQVIGLDGSYEFEEVSLPARQANRIEVRLYDRRNPQVPVAIHEKNRNASEFLLEDGAMIQMGGLGRTGNAVEDRGALDDRGLAGFYQARYGASERVTVEAAVQRSGDLNQLFGGVISRLTPSWVLSLGLANSGGAGGYRLDLDGQRAPWRLVAYSQAMEAEYLPHIAVSHYDHMLELGYERRGRWDLALVSRALRNEDGVVAYVLPAVAWRPVPTLAFRARPDRYGDYRFDLSYRIRPHSRVTARSIENRGLIDFAHEFSNAYQLLLETEFGGDTPDRQAVILDWHGASSWRPTWSAGALRTGGEPGYLAAGSLTVMPGVAATVRYESDTLGGPTQSVPDRRLLVHVTADLGFSRGRIHGARTTSVRDDRGGIAGAVRIEPRDALPRQSLKDLAILINGREVTRTENGGGFFIGGLRPGIYELELDSENLPIELTPVRARAIAEVAPAAVTRLDFAVRPEFGIAGRVVDATGAPVTDVTLQLLDDTGSRLQTTTTDRFGLYRLDRLPIGRYLLRLAPGVFDEKSVVLPQREIEIRDDFLFDQDLVLPFVTDKAQKPQQLVEHRRTPDARAGGGPTSPIWACLRVPRGL